MNRQGFALLTVFTLLLMLSLYYVTYPVSENRMDTQTMQSEIQPTGMEELENDLAERHESELQQAQQVIASGQADTEQKQQSLQETEQIRQSSLQEQTIVQSLNEQKITGCLAEIDEQIIRVVCPQQIRQQFEPSQILKTVAGYCNQHQTMELRFE